MNVTQCANSFRLFPFPAVLVEYCEVQLYESVERKDQVQKVNRNKAVECS